MSIESLEAIHNAVPLATVPLVILFPIWYAGRYEMKRSVAVMYSVAISVIILVFGYCCRWLGDLLRIPVSLNSARTFLFVPLFGWVLGKIWKLDTWQAIDFVTPQSFISRAIVMVGCTVLGCGNGVACDWGIYSPNRGYTVFPMDLIDVIASFVIGIVALVYARRLQYRGNGRVFGLAMICLGVARHLIQLGSADRYFGIRGFNEDAIISVISVIMGAVIFQRNENRMQNIKKPMEDRYYEK